MKKNAKQYEKEISDLKDRQEQMASIIEKAQDWVPLRDHEWHTNAHIMMMDISVEKSIEAKMSGTN